MTWEGYLGIAGVLASILFGYLAFTRNKKADDSLEGRQIGTILSDLGYVKANTDEIKAEQREQRRTNLEIFERLSSVESSTKQAHKRLDDHISEDAGKRSRIRAEKEG